MAVKRNLIANFLGQGWTALMGLIFIPVYIKYLGIDSFGLIAFFGVLQAWLALLDMGMAPTLNREMARFIGGASTADLIRDLLRSIETIAIAIAAITIFCIWLAADWIASYWINSEFLSDAVVSNAIVIMGFVIGFRFIETIYKSSIIGLQRQGVLNLVTSVMATLRGLGAVGILAFVSPTIEAYFYWQVCVSATSVIALSAITYLTIPKPSRRTTFSLTALVSVRSFLFGMFGVTFLSLLLVQLDKVILSKLLTLSEYGYYSLAIVVSGSVNTLSAPITQAFFPRLAELHASRSESTFAEVFHLGCQLVTVIVGTASLILVFYSHTLLLLWTTSELIAQQSSTVVSVYALGNFLNATLRVPYLAQLAFGWTSLAVKVNSLAVFAVVPAIVYAANNYGSIGAAWVWVLLNTGYLLIVSHLMFRRILCQHKLKWYIQDLLQPVVGAVAVLFLARTLLETPDSNFGKLALVLLIAGLSFTASAFLAPSVRRQIFITSNRLRTSVTTA